MDILVTYDIATLDPRGERRLARIAAICERYGIRAQYSVFECRLSGVGLQSLIGELADAVEADEDSIHIYRFDRPIRDVRMSLGRDRNPTVGDPYIIQPRNSSDL